MAARKLFARFVVFIAAFAVLYTVAWALGLLAT
jgi:hypothetical protein